MLNSLLTIIPLFFVIALGFISYKIKLSDEKWLPIFSKYTINISFPFLIFHALTQQKISKEYIWELGSINLSILAGLNIILYIIFKFLIKDKRKAGSWFIALIYGNVSFLGIPILDALYNKPLESALLSSVHLVFVLSISLISSEFILQQKGQLKGTLKRVFTNPLLWAIFAGTIVNFGNIEIPSQIGKPIKMVSDTATPVVLFWLGCFIAHELKAVAKEWKSALLYSSIKLLAIPFFIQLTLQLLFPDKNYSSYILDFGMPAAIAPFALADKFKFNKTLLASFIITSTILSIVTISIWH